jgi:DNA polymerase elongation subunit (family B)
MKEINSEVINDFLTGFDPMERIVTLECGYGDDQVSIIYNNDIGEKRVKKENYYPFVWVKQSAAQRLFDGNRVELKKKMAEFGIRVKGLNIYNKDGKTAERLENGYRVMFYASKRMAYNKFLRFFQIAGMPVYPNDKDKDQKSSSKDFLAVSPIEQFMIQTGKRLFKGYDDYDELTRLEFDLETQGLEPKLHAIDQIGIRTNRGFEKILTITGEGNERRKNELIAIEEAIKIIADIKPDVITGHNSENFDWNYLIVRCDVLGSSMQEISSKYFKQALYKKKRQTVLKLGGEIEYYYPTVLWGYNITDSLHAVRRAQAQDSNMKKADLKYVTKYSKLNKPNRVYVPGDQIKKVWAITDPVYAFNNTNGLWYRITDEKPLQEGYEVTTGKYIVERYLLDDLYETDKVELRYNQSNFLLAKLLPTNFGKICTMGTAGTWKMIMLAWSYENDLAIPAFSTAKKFTGGLSRLLSVGYVDRIVKLDYNSLYPSIILTWDIASELDISGVMLQLLAYILDQREKFKGLKKKAKKHAEKLKDQKDIFQGTDEELRELIAEIQKWESEESANDKKQLPFKIFGNSFFGGFGAPDIFPWGDLICAEMTTCIGRQSLRLMIKWFSDRGYKPIVGDTDGFNFQMPSEEILKTRVYIGKGLNREVKEGKEYHGVEADVAEFNDLFMRGKMGLGIDEYADATINFARKNYADLLAGGEVKLVGNTIKSKKMPTYIEKFVNEGVELLLKGDGQKFLENYYDYIEKIYNYKIPLRDIASKGKIKKPVKEYIEDCKTLTKAGRPKSRQAWYELVIREEVKVDVGDTIYYINTGKAKSHSDVKKVTTKDKIDKETGEIIEKGSVKIQLNCALLSNDIVEAEHDTFCDDNIEYNVPKYIDQFNKRITPLLVCFSSDIRNEILVKNPDDRKYWTKEQSILVSGQPNRVIDQDTYEQLLTMEDKEIKYWISVNKTPPFVEEIGINWEETVEDYQERMKELEREELKIIVEEYNKIIDELTKEDVEIFEEEGKLPKRLLDIVREDVFSTNLYAKDYDVVIGSLFDIRDKVFTDEAEIKYNEYIESYSE